MSDTTWSNFCRAFRITWAKLHFTGTTNWYSNQKVDENINNWHNYQMLIKISKAIDKNVNSWKGDNLTKMSILTEISNLTELSILTEWSILTEMSILTRISILTKRSIWQKGQQYTSTSPTSSHLMNYATCICCTKKKFKLLPSLTVV